MKRTYDQQLLAEVENTYRQFMYLPHEHSFTVASLWVAHSHLRAIDGTFLPQRTPRLVWLSKSAGCGKTMGMELTALMSHNGEIATVPTQFSLISAINNNLGTIGLDEIDKFFGNRGTSKQDIQAIINSGYKRGAYVTRQRNDEVDYLNCHGPFTMAGKNANRFMTSDVFETTRTRSIPMLLERKPVGHPVDKYKSTTHERRLRDIAKRLQRWGLSSAHDIVRINVEPIMDSLGIDNRDEEIWTILFQIAQYVGGDWPARIVAAAKALLLGDWGDDEVPQLSPAEELLEWVRASFIDDEAFLPTRTLLQRLMALDGDHWWRREWHTPNGAAQGLSRTLDGVFGIEATRGYVEGVQVRGYNLVDLQDGEDEETGLGAGDGEDKASDPTAWDWSQV